MHEPFRFPIEIEGPSEEEVAERVKGPPGSIERFSAPDTVLKNITQLIGPMYKNRALGFMQWLMQLPELGWNQKWEVVINGETIPKSNIVTLVVDAVKPFRKSVPPPVGWMAFGNLLTRNNASHIYVSNAIRYMSGFFDESTIPAAKAQRRKQTDDFNFSPVYAEKPNFIPPTYAEVAGSPPPAYAQVTTRQANKQAKKDDRLEDDWDFNRMITKPKKNKK